VVVGSCHAWRPRRTRSCEPEVRHLPERPID